MPVYIRKNVSFTPPSIDNIPLEHEDDYLNDPDQIKDDLPQPYRMIDKVLSNIVYETWEVIADREEKRLEDARKVRPPTYEYAVKLEGPVAGAKDPEKLNFTYATCIAGSRDGRHIFIGLPCGLVAIDALTQQFLGAWEEEKAELVYIKSYQMGPQHCLIAAIDDMGIGRLFAFANNKVFLLRVLNNNPPDSESKILISKLEASTEGDYLGLVMENPSSRDVWLEVHKLPRDIWVTEMDTVIAAIRKRDEKKEEPSEQDTESVSEVGGGATAGGNQQDGAPAPAPSVDTAETTQSQPDKRPESSMSRRPDSSLHVASSLPPPPRRMFDRYSYRRRRTQSRPPSEGVGEASDGTQVPEHRPRKDPLSSDYKFAASQVIMKVKPPSPITGMLAPTLHAACQKVDTGDVIGTGQAHIFTQNHLDTRQHVFNHLHDNLLRYLPQDEEEPTPQQPYFYFLTAGRMLPMGLEQASLEGRPTTVAVWWPEATNLQQYSLIKASKDVEFKPDLVWPFTSKITAMSISTDTNILAIGLENGNVVLWDKYIGTQRGVTSVARDSAVIQLKFLDPSMYPQEDNSYPPYSTKAGAYLLVRCANSAIYTIGTGPGVASYASCISLACEAEEDAITVMETFDTHEDVLMTVLSKGTIQLRDTLKGKILCEIQLPGTHEMSSSWEPIMAIGGQGQMLYIKGNTKSNDEGSETESSSTLQTGTVFVYQLRSFPTLDTYLATSRPSRPFTIHTTLDQRVDALLADRLAQQGLRKVTMQERWAMMKNEINSIHKLKETARKNADARPVFTPGSVGLYLPVQ